MRLTTSALVTVKVEDPTALTTPSWAVRVVALPLTLTVKLPCSTGPHWGGRLRVAHSFGVNSALSESQPGIFGNGLSCLALACRLTRTASATLVRTAPDTAPD